MAEQVADVLRGIRGAVDVATDQLSLLPVVRIEVDEDAISRYGVARRDVLATIQALGTPQAGEVREGQRRFPLVVRLAEPYRRDWQALGQLLVCTPGGARLPLARLAKIDEVEHAGHDLARMEQAADCWCSATSAAATSARSSPKPRQRSTGLPRTWPTGYYGRLGRPVRGNAAGPDGGWRSSCRWPAC